MSLRNKIRIHLALGTMDAATGLGLVFFPALTLSLMGITDFELGTLAMIRFTGSFVLAVGLCYFLPFVSKPFSKQSLLSIWSATALIRIVVGTVLLGLILFQVLPWVWGSITIVDWGVATLQLVWLREESHE